MEKFNLTKVAKKSGIRNYNKMLEDSTVSTDVATKNINLSLETKDKDNTVPFNVQLNAVRKAEKDQVITEKSFDESTKLYNDKRLDQTGDVQPINLETIKHEQKRAKALEEAQGDSETTFWDRVLGAKGKTEPMPINSQLQNNPDRFDKIEDATKAKYDKMVYASLKDADAMLFHIYMSAETEKRELTAQERQQIIDINSGKARILTTIKTGK